MTPVRAKALLQALICTALLLYTACAVAQAPPTAAWDGLLQRHVRVIDNGHASQVDYAGMRRDQAQLDGYIQQLSAVTAERFHGWDRDDQVAFLVNAYNAFTVQLVLTRWPALRSIKDIGGLFSSPWKQDFFTLLGQRSNLDQIETRLRGRDHDEPRIHFALNRASIGCPMLRPHAYVGKQLDRQLDDATSRFLADRSRNRYERENDVLRVSRIFDWYAEDFRHGRYASVAALLAEYATQLSDDPQVIARIRAQDVRIDYLPYDWQLNGLPTR